MRTGNFLLATAAAATLASCGGSEGYPAPEPMPRAELECQFDRVSLAPGEGVEIRAGNKFVQAINQTNTGERLVKLALYNAYPTPGSDRLEYSGMSPYGKPQGALRVEGSGEGSFEYDGSTYQVIVQPNPEEASQALNVPLKIADVSLCTDNPYARRYSLVR